MANVTDIWLFVQTSTVDHANSTANLQLNVNFHTIAGQPPPPLSVVELPTASQQTASNGINQLGASAQFHWSQQGNWPVGAMPTGNISEFTLEIVGPNSDDAWIPASIWVVFKTDVGQYVLGPQSPKWDGSCFSTQSSDCSGTAKPSWSLPWSKSEPIVEFTAGAIDEGQLEPSESATYTFEVVNLTDTLTLSELVIAVLYDVEQYQKNGVTIDVPIGSLGVPEITVNQLLPPGERIPIKFTIDTSDATPMTYTFQLGLLSWQIVAVSTNLARFFIDEGQSFAVVPD